jgi:hypothetical protein
MLNNGTNEGTYILPPNNGNIPKIPLIVEEAWYSSSGADANVISLFGNTSQQIYTDNIGSTGSGYTPTPNLSTLVQFEYYSGYIYLKSTVTNSILNETSFPTSGGTFYSYFIVNSSYAQTGYFYYSDYFYDYYNGSSQVWVPLTLLDSYYLYNNLVYPYPYDNVISYNLNYNPFQYGTLEIGAGTDSSTSYQYIEWVVARAYPPNGIMPSIYIG